MRNLIRTDLKRIFKDKLFMIVCILGGAFALFSPLLYQMLFGMLGADDMLDMAVSAKSLFFGAFSPSGDFGLILPILIAIVICKDFSHGTVRNKIISGKSRTKIFLSMFISSASVMCGVILAHAVLTLLVSLIFFEYQIGGFGGGDFLYLLISVIFALLVYIFVAALVSFLCVYMKNMGLVIVMYVAVNFLFTIIGSITSISLAFADPTNEAMYSVIEFFNNINIFTSGLIGAGSSYEAMDVLCILLPTIAGSALFLFLGILVFKKKDLK